MTRKQRWQFAWQTAKRPVSPRSPTAAAVASLLMPLAAIV